MPRQELALVVWWALGVAVVLGLLPLSRPARGALVPFGGLALMLVLTGLSLAWTASQEATSAELARVALYAGVLVALALALDRRSWTAAAAGLGTVAVAVAVAATISRLAPGIGGHSVQRVLQTTRLSYPLNYWNGVGAWSAMAVTIALAVSAHTRSRALRAGALALVPTCALAVYLTYSRAGVIDVAIGIVAVLALARHRWTMAIHSTVAALATAAAVAVIRDEPQIAHASGTAGAPTVGLVLAAGAGLCAGAALLTRRLGADERLRVSPGTARAGVAVLVAVLCLAAGGLAVSGVASRAWSQFKTPASGAALADPADRLANLNSLRYQIWRSAWKAWRDHPLDGIGAGTFDLWWARNATNSLYVRNAHSLYLENLAELGVGGLLAVLLLAGGLVTAAVRTRRGLATAAEIGTHAALMAATIIFFLHAGIDWLWQSTAVGLLGVSCAATAAAASAPPVQRSLRPLPRACFALVAAGFCLLQLPGIVAITKERSSQKALGQGETSAALRLADDSVRAEPWAASTYAQRSQVLLDRGNLAAARIDIGRAIADEPTNWRYPFLLARLEAAAGRTGAALRALSEARRLHPRSALFAR